MKTKSYKIDLEIYVVFVIVIGISVINAIYSSVYISRNQDVTTGIMTTDIPSLQALENMNLLVTKSKMYTTNWVYLQGNREDKEQLKTLQNLEYPQLKNTLTALMASWKDHVNVDSMNAIFQNFEQLMVYQKKIMNLLVSFDSYEDPLTKFSAEEIIENEVLPKTADIITRLNAIILEKKAFADQQHHEMMASSRTLMWSVLGIAILIVLVILIAAFYMSDHIIVPTMKLKSYILQIAQGEIPEVQMKVRKNAIGQMTEAVQVLSASFTRTAHFAHNIGEGNFNTDFQPLGQNDELGNALIHMRESLLSADRDNKKRHWISNGIERLNEILRENNDNIDLLSEEIISNLVRFLNSYHGGIYLLEEGENKNTSWIELHGCYAMEGHVRSKRKIEPGEGLVGQAIKEGKMIYLQNAPGNYVTINSGLGEYPATHVLIVPLRHHGVVYGAVELASYSPYEEHEIEFVENIGNTIASTIHSVKANTLTKRLLEETRKQTERLASQEEELRQTNDELSHQSKLLQASEEELKQSNIELKRKARELKQQNEILEQAREALSLKARELELNSKFKSEFLANMSHELRTPLNSVLILARLLAENKGSNLSEKQIEYAKVIHKSGSDLLTLINDILDLSKIEAGKIDMILEPTTIQTVKDDLQSLFSELAREKKIDYSIEQHSGCPGTIVTDRLRLEQILKNLLSNAFKFTAEGGKVTLRVKRPDKGVILSRPELRRSRNVIEFSVTDSGIGIPQEQQQHIFEAFQQADGSTSRRYGGTGLGLSITKMLVGLLGGEMQLRSEQGKGSTFYVYLPMESKPVEPGSNEETPQATFVENTPQAGQTESAGNDAPLSGPQPEPVLNDDRDLITAGDKVLLIVEDDLTFAQILLDMAHEKNYKALVANQGDTGLQLAEAYLPSAIIMDMKLPGMDGWSVLNKMKANEKLSQIPVHIMSAMDRNILGLEMGAAAYLRKPLDKKDLDDAFSRIDQTIDKDIKRVLLIEDNTIEQDIVRNLLQNRDHHLRLLSAKNMQEANHHLQEEHIDCIILDLDLGKGHEQGLCLLESIRNSSLHAKTPVIIFTGIEITEEEERWIKQHSEAIIMKNGQSIDRLIEETEIFLQKVHEQDTNTPAPALPAIMHNMLEGKKVLLVDDDMRNIYALTSVLEGQGMQVISAVNGREAIDKLVANHGIEIILMDIMMPEMDGYQAMQTIRKMENYKTLPIISLTAKAMVGDREKCFQAGASDYISKPVNIDQLLSLMRVWLYQA